MALPDEIEKRIRSCRSLPTMPGVAMRLVEICGSEETSLQQIAALIRQDPALASKVLRYANSAVFGLSASVTSLQRAAVLLGLLTLQTTALSFSLVSTMQSATVGGFDHQRYWRRSLYCAASAQALAEHLGNPTPEVLFMAGLLDDLGMLVLAHALGPRYTAVLANAGGGHAEIVEAERRHLGFDHAAVTAWIEREWRLPAAFAAAAEASHRSLEGASRGLRGSASSGSIVALASLFGDVFTAADPRDASERLQSVASKSFSIDCDTVSDLLDRTSRLAASGAALLNIDGGSAEENANTLELARECLFAASMRSTREQNIILDESQRDALTGLWNRRYLERAVDARFAEAMQSGRPLGAVFVDIDHFKAVNDAHGHAVGDVVLKAVATRLQRLVRSTDVVARYGGEEFVILCSNLPATSARAVCPAICERLAREPIDRGDGRSLPLTVSVGFATTDGSAAGTATELLKRADVGLYASKRNGRNRATEG